jgi:hypothetical protein
LEVPVRIVIVSREAPEADGVLTAPVGAARAAELDEALRAEREAVADNMVLQGLAIGFGLPKGALAKLLTVLPISFSPPSKYYLDGLRDGLAQSADDKAPAVIRHAGAQYTLRPPRPSDDLGGCTGIVINSGSRIRDGESLLFSRVAVEKQLPAVLAADGGNSAVHVLSQRRARTHLRRQGGGILEDGVYCLHPKREDVLVPLASYHADLLAEMQREARVTMGRLGAKKLTIETMEGVSFGGSVVSRVPLKSGGFDLQGASKEERSVTYEWGSPTYEPEAALRDCLLLQDNAGVMTIVDQRRTSNLTKFEEFSRIDTRFGVGLDVMSVFKVGFAWAAESTYRYSVEFFDRPNPGR